ncbi:MAG: hypothetical protein ACTSPE_10025 [Candidatus Thorarchaeota archaeon]
MSQDDEEMPAAPDIDSGGGVTWDKIVYQEHDAQSTVSLDATDYVALFIASLQTVFLPIVIVGIMFVLIGFFLTLLR